MSWSIITVGLLRVRRGPGSGHGVGHGARQVFDLPDPRPLVVTEHRAHDCRCADCGANAGAVPEGVDAPCSTARGSVLLLYLHYRLLPEKRLVE